MESPLRHTFILSPRSAGCVFAPAALCLVGALIPVTLRSLLVVVVISCFPSHGHATSFDCGKASTGVERMICADKELSALDEGLAEVYRQGLAVSAEKYILQRTQRKWLKGRDGCTDRECVKAAYTIRLRQIRAIFSFIDVTTGAAFPPERRYPPYPEVWARQVPAHYSGFTYAVASGLYRLPDGDILMSYGASMEQDGRMRLAALSFFDQRQWDEDEIVEVLNNGVLPRAEVPQRGEHNGWYEVTFSDGSYLAQEGWGHPKGCDDRMSHDFVLYDASGRELMRKKLIHLLPTPKYDYREGRCAEVTEEPDTFVIRAETTLWAAAPLEDETFLISSFDTNWVLRFDRHLNTRAALGEEWIIIDAAEWYDIQTPADINDQQRMDIRVEYLRTKLTKEKTP